MAPLGVRNVYRSHLLFSRADPSYGDWRSTSDKEALILEGWGEGFMLGALLIMSLITIANMRKGVLLHKLILLELLLAMTHGTFGLMAWNGYGWYLSSTAALLYCSYFIHNVVSWLKIRPFFREPQATFKPLTCTLVRWIYLSTLALTAPVLIFEIFNNFRYFNNINTLYVKVRPYEPLMRDPWWVFACLVLLHVIRKCYGLNLWKLVRKSPRFGILLASIFAAIVFTCCDIVASVEPELSLTDGINPYWKLALVFKSLTDNIMLDDFKAVLQRLGALKLDGRNAMLSDNSMNMTPDPKAGEGRDDSDEYHEDITPQRSPPHQQDDWRRTSISGRMLEEGETLDDDGYTRRRQSMASSGVGKIGRKLRRLGNLGSIQKSAEREARKNMERNKDMSVSSGHGQDTKHNDSQWSDSTVMQHSDSNPSQKGQEEQESVDFITSALH